MKRGFYTIMAAQFFSSLADNALLVVAIALLVELHAPAYLTPMLKFVFVLFYVILAPFVGAFADSMAKGRVMFISNTSRSWVAACFSWHRTSILPSPPMRSSGLEPPPTLLPNTASSPNCCPRKNWSLPMAGSKV